MRFHNRPADGQSQAGAAYSTRFPTIELLKNPLLLSMFEAGAAVAHFEYDRTVRRLRRDFDGCAFGRIFDSVLKQV